MLIGVQVSSISHNLTYLVDTGVFSIYAESTSDYTTVSRVAIFQQCETLVCEQINITDDLNLELTETFIIGLHRTPTLDPRIRLNPVNTVVEIQDNDGKSS